MWVRITAVHDGRLAGVLPNRPRYATHVTQGDVVLLDEAEIAAVDAAG